MEELESPTSWVSVTRSNQLSYTPMWHRRRLEPHYCWLMFRRVDTTLPLETTNRRYLRVALILSDQQHLKCVILLSFGLQPKIKLSACSAYRREGEIRTHVEPATLSTVHQTEEIHPYCGETFTLLRFLFQWTDSTRFLVVVRKQQCVWKFFHPLYARLLETLFLP